MKNSNDDHENNTSKGHILMKNINFNLLRNKHLEKNNKSLNKNVAFNNYNNNLNLSINKGKSISRNQNTNTNSKSILCLKNDADNNSYRKVVLSQRKYSSNSKNEIMMKDKLSIKTDYNSYINNKNHSDKKTNKNSINENFNVKNIAKNNCSSLNNLKLIPEDFDLAFCNNFSKSNRNTDSDKYDFISSRDENLNNTQNNDNKIFNNHMRNKSNFCEISKDNSINNYSKDLDKIFNYEKEQNLNEKAIKNNNYEKKYNKDLNKYDYLINDTENNNNNYEKSNINLNTYQNKNNKNSYKNFNTSINATNNTSRNISSKYNYNSFNQNMSKNSNICNNNLKLINKKNEINAPTFLKAQTNNIQNGINSIINYIKIIVF